MPLLALLLLLAADAPEPVRGRLCVGELKKPLTQCSDVRGRAFAVAPDERDRVFVWTTADGSTAQLGVVAARAEKVDLDAGERSTLDLTISGEPSRGWPLDVKAVVGHREHFWTWVVDARTATRLRRIVVPRGPVALSLRAEHHADFKRSLNAKDERVAVGVIALVPLPQARGIVVDAEGKAITGAQVTLMDATTCANTDDRGAFACELGERRRPQEGITVSSGGYAARDLELPGDLRGEIDFGRVTLTKARALTVTVVRPEAAAGTVTLYSDIKSRYDHSRLATRDLREREEVVRFDAGEGDYLVVVEGKESTERLEVPVKMKDADVEKTITVKPYRLIGTLRFGDDVIATGTIGINAPDHTWRAEIPVTAGGFEATFWQRGRMFAWVKAPELGRTSERVEMPETTGTDPTRWDIRIEKKMIVGRVLDAQTKQPVSGVRMQLTAESDNSKFYTSVEPEADGSYRIMSSRPGTYSLRITAPGYAPLSIDVPVTAEDRIKTVDIALDRGVVQPLEIVLASGAPARAAMILEGVQPDRVNPQFMFNADPEGRFELRGKPGETRLIYIVPREGSFAVLRLVMPKEAGAGPLRVVVPDGTATLRVRATTADDKPAAAGLLIRYNGEFVPGAILRFVTKVAIGTEDNGKAVFARLPAGMYEVWAVAGQRDDAMMVATGGVSRPPARVGLSAGEGAVQVVAPPREVRRRGE
ncbi:MAG TPA: carboxypeptidase-like regulatory domain-containing protein [Thermoanaerobaculia bacterium]|nr:carboxypeptidase-like regulatory domain-containing protein [Thermoanaerobaculia bacterium]